MSDKFHSEVLAELNDAWLNVYKQDHELIKPLDILSTNDSPEEYHKKLIWLITQTDYLGFFCKHILNIELLPFQVMILQELWNRRFPMLIMTRGGSKTFMLSLYALLRALLIPNRKVVAVGAAFRQSKFIHEYMETFWKNAPIVRNMCSGSSGPRRDVDMCRMIIGSSTVTCLPIGDGTKIRGQRAQDILADEFAAQSREIFETVIAGFGSVTASPAENVKKQAIENKAKELGIPLNTVAEMVEKTDQGNQIVFSGTCDYAFGHFAEYWRRWKQIIQSGGDEHKLESVFNGPIPKGFNWKDYSVTRIPYDVLPEGFMDATQIARAKATVNTGVFSMEYSACFPRDSKGFFKRSLIESCVGSRVKPVELPSGEVCFDPMLRGDPTKEYVIGIDPASEVDNFSIVILELRPDHNRIVYCWTTSRSRHIERVKRGLTDEKDFYSYAARKVRDLMALFPTVHIAMDSQGGGIAVNEAFHDDDKIKPGEVALWPIIEDGKEKDTDFHPGLHIVEMCNFAKADWLGEANHGMRKDFEDKVLLFPDFDPLTIGLSIQDDKLKGRGSAEPDSEGLYDTLEDAVMEIEELKDELSIIEISRTPSGRDKWDTPEVRVGVGKKNRLRKDRYSSLVIANMAARQIKRVMKHEMKCDAIGGFAVKSPSDSSDYDGPGFTGPSWFLEQIDGVYS